MELKHHGIRGQRWGKRNGPPYPLDESDKSAAEKKEKKKLRGAAFIVKEKLDEKDWKEMSAVEKKWAQGKEEETDRTKDYKPRSILTSKHKRLTTVKEMSDEELNERINRLNRETKYLQLERSLDDLDPAEVRSTLSRALSTVGNKVVVPAISAAAAVAMYKLLEKIKVSNFNPEDLDLIKRTVTAALTKTKK